jgi:hypothetical protein
VNDWANCSLASARLQWQEKVRLAIQAREFGKIIRKELSEDRWPVRLTDLIIYDKLVEANPPE